MQNIHVKRYEHPENVGWAGTVEPEDRSWILFIPLEEGKAPQLFLEVEYAVDEADDNPEAFERDDVKTAKGYTPAIYLDDRVTVKEEAQLSS